MTYCRALHRDFAPIQGVIFWAETRGTKGVIFGPSGIGKTSLLWTLDLDAVGGGAFLVPNRLK